jgi:hypothetical protein
MTKSQESWLIAMTIVGIEIVFFIACAAFGIEPGKIFIYAVALPIVGILLLLPLAFVAIAIGLLKPRR